MQLRSGATTGGTAPRTPPRSPSPTGGGVPEQIEITSPQRQEENEEDPIPSTPIQSPQVYAAGTYVADFGRSPSVPATSGQLNSLSYHSQIIGQQGSQVVQEIQIIMQGNLMYLILSQNNQ